MSIELLRTCECGCGKPTPVTKRTDKSRGQVQGQQVRFLRGHNAKFWSRPRPAEDRFVERVEVDSGSGCWNWTGSRDRFGYGHLNVKGRDQLAHRFAYSGGKRRCRYCNLEWRRARRAKTSAALIGGRDE